MNGTDRRGRNARRAPGHARASGGPASPRRFLDPRAEGAPL